MFNLLSEKIKLDEVGLFSLSSFCKPADRTTLSKTVKIS